jgi:hypothetical protein
LSTFVQLGERPSAVAAARPSADDPIMNNLVTAASSLALLFVPVVPGLAIRRLGAGDGIGLGELFQAGTVGFVVGTSPTVAGPEPDFVPWRFDQLPEPIDAAEGIASLQPADVLRPAA